MQATADTTVLIVEDDARLQAILAKGLQSCGFPTHAAGSLAAAYEVLRSTAVEVIVVDLGLPDGSGWDLVRWATSRDERRLRTIVITAAYGPLEPEPQLRPDACLNKPFAIDELVRRITVATPDLSADRQPVARNGQ